MNSVEKIGVDKEALAVLQGYPADAKVGDLYDANDDLSRALISIFGEAFEYPDFSHRTMEQVVKMVEKQLGLAAPAAQVFDPLSVAGYAQIMANPKLQLHWQDKLDSFFGERIVDVRNAIRDLGWEGAPRASTLAKEDMRVGFEAVHVGAGRNVVGGKWQLSQVDNPGFLKAHGGEVVLVDDLRLDPKAIAGEIMSIYVRDKTRIFKNSKLLPVELSLSEFSEIAKIEKLENHGRKWSVSFDGYALGFADSPSKLDVFREVHLRQVSNAIYGHSTDAPDSLKSGVFPSNSALAEYPELREKFADVFAIRDVQERTQRIIETVRDFIDEHADWWDDQLSAAANDDIRYKLESWAWSMSSPGDPTNAKTCLSTFVDVVQNAEIDWIDKSDEKCVENILFIEAQSIVDPILSIDRKKLGPLFDIGQKFDFKAGEEVVANGYRGTVVKAGGQLGGMVEVRLPGGVACMSASFPDCFPAVTNGVEVVLEGRFSGKVEEVTNQFVVQNSGRGRLVAHETHRFAVLPVVGERVNLIHKGGQVDFMVEVAKGKGNER